MRSGVLGYILTGMAFGILTELIAWRLRLWVYRQPQTPILNVIVMFGLVMGGVASLVPMHGLLPGFLAGGVLGLLYELANLKVLHWWDFPDQRMAFVSGHTAILIVLSVAWGLLPPLIAVAWVAAPRIVRPATLPQSPIERLNENEKRLLDKLDGLRQREREIEARLDYLRARKRMLLERQSVRPPGVPATPVVPAP